MSLSFYIYKIIIIIDVKMVHDNIVDEVDFTNYQISTDYKDCFLIGV